MKKYVAELIGTMILVLMGCGSAVFAGGAADTVGAGDSFTAAFVAAILSGKTVREAHELAVETSAYVCTQNGAMPELPAELINRLK